MGNSNGNEVAGNKENNGKGSNHNGMATMVVDDKKGNGEGRKSDGNGDKEGKGEASKSNGGVNEEGKEEGNNMGNTYINKGGRQTTAVPMVMATTKMWAMVMSTRWWATKRVLVRLTRVMAMATRVAGKQRHNNCDGDRDCAKDMAAHAMNRSSAMTNALDSVTWWRRGCDKFFVPATLACLLMAA
jgi:hypothetical protein